MMKRYEMNLFQYFQKVKRVTTKEILFIVRQLIEGLEVVHETGFVYNDLKLDNIMV